MLHNETRKFYRKSISNTKDIRPAVAAKATGNQMVPCIPVRFLSAAMELPPLLRLSTNSPPLLLHQLCLSSSLSLSPLHRTGPEWDWDGTGRGRGRGRAGPDLNAGTGDRDLPLWTKKMFRKVGTWGRHFRLHDPEPPLFMIWIPLSSIKTCMIPFKKPNM